MTFWLRRHLVGQLTFVSDWIAGCVVLTWKIASVVRRPLVPGEVFDEAWIPEQDDGGDLTEDTVSGVSQHFSSIQHSLVSVTLAAYAVVVGQPSSEVPQRKSAVTWAPYVKESIQLS